jgi:hypothetical protein
MRRRGFLQCIALSTVAAVLPWRDLSGWQIDGEATSPGARLRVIVARHVPGGSTLTIDVAHEKQDGVILRSRHSAQIVVAGQELEVVTPYPYTDLVPGQYAISLLLHDAHGRELDRHDAGSYAIRRFRFSA